MKHVTYTNKSFFLDDEAADLLTEYAALLGSSELSDTVDVRVLGTDGNEVTATLVLNGNTELVVETTNSGVEMPANDEVAAYMRDAILRISSPPESKPEADVEHDSQYVDDF